MKELIIEPTKIEPGVRLSGNNLLLYGRIMISDPGPFFDPLLNWINAYMQDPGETTELNLKLEYINAASIQSILKVMTLLKELEDEGRNITINWYYQYGDLEMLQLGVILQGRLEKDFEFHEFEPPNRSIV